MFGGGKARSPRKAGRPLSIVRAGPAYSGDAQDNGDPSEPNTLPKLVIDVHNEINVGWDFMTSSDFNPVPHALSLLDESSLGRDYNAFCEAYDKLERAMDLIVNEYHQAFNTAIQTFSSVVENITDSQRRVRDTRKNLQNSKEWLQCKRFDLLHLWLKSIQYKEINRILDTIEELQNMPDRLDALVQGKYYLTAVRLLVSATRTVEEGECSEIGALEAVKQRLQEMRGTIHETLIEELHNHLYLKSAFSLYRLDSVDHYTLRKQTTVKFIHGRHSTKGNEGGILHDRGRRHVPTKPGHDPLQEKLAKLREDADSGQEITEDLETNPETDSYHYMLCLIESLALLGRLRPAMEVIRERLPVELYYVVERTVQEVDHRYGKLGSSVEETLRGGIDSQGPNLLGTDARKAEIRVLLEFLWELFRKFEAIIHGHTFLQAIVQELTKRQSGIKLDGLYTIRDVWFTAQNELKALLYEYVRNPERKTSEPGVVVSLNDILKDRRRAKLRTDSRPLFRIIGADNKDMKTAYKGINPEAEETAENVVANVRQLVDGQDPEDSEDGAAVGVVDTYASNTVVAGHRLLITPDPYNILVVFGPTTGFVQRMESMLNVRFGNLRIFLDEFVINMFLPQMENRVSSYFHNYVNGMDAFHTDFHVELSSFPLTKSATALVVLIEGICRTLPSIPIHQDEAIRMIEMVLRSYTDKCSSRFNALISSNQPGADGGYSSIVSASWVREPEVVEILSQHTLFRSDGMEIESPVDQTLSQKETFLEMKLKKERSFHRSELIMELRTLQAIASLHHSIEWFISQVSRLFVTDTAKMRVAPFLSQVKTRKGSSESLDSYFKLSSESLPDLRVEHEENLQLWLTPEMAQKFQAVVSDLQRLSDLCLFVLRVELRCHSMYYLDLAMREGSYYLEDDTLEPDPYIGLLNLDLSTIEEAISAVLHPRRTRFIFDGLAYLIAHTLCSNLRYIRRVNRHGVSKLVRNVQSLQQNLTNVTSVNFRSLDRAKQYFELLNLNGESLLDYVAQNQGQFTFDEYKVVLDIIFYDALAGDNTVQRKTYNDCLQKLKEWFVKHR
ncbi:uncharacterized protein SPPG_03510 [Spizellomyces punctatus DAOM BR117]|uniref:Exocyst complex component Sec8 n=1 Tax=Spizellomyces punctatus (strain DAOM BR117) TaxID=645134 RepID=A0A0L0HKT7_SPIPD|nr:uncharacterized protein SPPG_03510 [Spizellomyces punctatus DAOM BR117]KND01717.1 hypothetical protein SPPG_03510 [Spizellomyces punctatus DAOM BR117]|eukprot:XP_016609756.1 hypothetical protein SPPG_03510 [Spizellomyces punctatus DAOM BR117]